MGSFSCCRVEDTRSSGALRALWGVSALGVGSLASWSFRARLKLPFSISLQSLPTCECGRKSSFWCYVQFDFSFFFFHIRFLSTARDAEPKQVKTEYFLGCRPLWERQFEKQSDWPASSRMVHAQRRAWLASSHAARHPFDRNGAKAVVLSQPHRHILMRLLRLSVAVWTSRAGLAFEPDWNCFDRCAYGVRRMAGAVHRIGLSSLCRLAAKPICICLAIVGQIGIMSLWSQPILSFSPPIASQKNTVAAHFGSYVLFSNGDYFLCHAPQTGCSSPGSP